MSHALFSGERTIRLLLDFPVEGLHMKGWIVSKTAREAAVLVQGGFAEYVPLGTQPPPSQMEWGLAMERAVRSSGAS